jgi:glycosyltransferase involved in cell wall biosynthesis
MKCLFCTADAIGTKTGGGIVTYNELESLKIVGETTSISRDILNPSLYQQPDSPYVFDFIADAHVLYNKIKPDLAHFYAGTFSKTIMRLKQMGALVTYTAAAHDPDVSREEFIRNGYEFNLPHITNPALWASYLEGYLLADLVICPSKASEIIMRKFGCKNVTVIPHGVELPLYTQPISTKFTVGYLGQVGPDKGLAYLFKAWKDLDWQDARLHLAGRGTELLKRQVDANGIKNTDVAGFVEFTSDFYNAISVYVQPSATEGFGIEVLEAMAHGRPVVVSAGAGAADVVTDGVDGFVVPARDACAIADRLKFLKGSADLQKMSEEAKKKAARYTWDLVRPRYTEVWKGLFK